MRKKLLTLEDLVKFCQEQKLYSFSAKETGEPICVLVPATFEKNEDEDEESSLLYATVKAFHTGENRNHSFVTEDAAKKAMKTMAYKPLLANFVKNPETGEWDFTSHDFTINDDGKIEYQEYQIGCFTADAPYFEQDPNREDRKFVCATVAIPREYTAAADIIERKNGTKVSVELCIYEMAYNSKEKILMLTDVEVSGLTCLGVNPDRNYEEVQEGMEGARLDIADFSIEKNSVCSDYEKTMNIMQELKQSLDNYMTAFAESNSMKGGKTGMTIFEEDVEVTETSEEEVATEEEVTTEEEVNETETEESTEEVIVTEAESEETNEVTPEEDSENNDELMDNFATLSVTVNGETKTFSASLIEKLNALYTLVNETYSDSDNDFYDIDADDENKFVYMMGFFSGKNYKQKYSVKKDVFSLQGDRVECFRKLLTQDEINQLEQIKSTYAEVSDKLAKYEAEPEKMEILNSEDYSSIAESEEFVAFKSQEAHFDLSVDEVRAKADEMLLNAAKAGKVEFSAKESEEKKEIGVKKLPVNTAKKRSRYGGLGKTKSE